MSTLLQSSPGASIGQLQVSNQRRMPVDDGTTANTQSVTGETVQFFYYDNSTGVLTQDAGQAAGTVVVANLANKNVLNALGDVIGNFGDSSFSFTTGTILTSMKPFRGLLAEQAEQNGLTQTKSGQARAIAVTQGFGRGDYCIDHERGVIYGVKATTGTSDTGAYKVLTPGGGSAVPENVNISKVNGTSTFAGQTSNGTTVTGFANVLPMARYDSTPTARTTGQFGNLQADANGNLQVNVASLMSGEDQTNNVLGTVDVPLAVSTYAPDVDVSTAAEASSVTKASSGNLFGFTATNSSGSNRYFQIFNSTTVPADATVPTLSFYVGAGGTLHEIFARPRFFNTGIAWCWSSTAATKTIGSTDGIADVRYK